MRRILKWDVPVGSVVEIGGGPVTHVACQVVAEVVQVWTDETGDPPTGSTRTVRVVGTGHAIGDDAGPVLGTALAGPLVWHVVEVTR